MQEKKTGRTERLVIVRIIQAAGAADRNANELGTSAEQSIQRGRKTMKKKHLEQNKAGPQWSAKNLQ